MVCATCSCRFRWEPTPAGIRARRDSARAIRVISPAATFRSSARSRTATLPTIPDRRWRSATPPMPTTSPRSRQPRTAWSRNVCCFRRMRLSRSARPMLLRFPDPSETTATEKHRGSIRCISQDPRSSADGSNRGNQIMVETSLTTIFHRRYGVLHLGITAALAAGTLCAAPFAQARITNIAANPPAIAFGGYSFPGVGQYEEITGIATGEVNPLDPKNAVITDIALAPRNANGNVVYQFNFYILRPVNGGNHKMMYEPPNRGRKTYQTLNRTPAGTDDPGAITDADTLANSFLWTRGYTTVWTGWENNLGPLNGLVATASLPVAGSNITGPAYEYIVTGNPTFTLTYPAASGDQANAKLTHRVHLDDVPPPSQDVPASGWAYTDATNTAIKLTTGNFVNNDIYEFSYIAKNPTVNGLGLAAIRDFASFLRYAKADDVGTLNPLAGDVQRIYTETSSQPARTLNDFVHLGFNEDEQHHKVFDGMMQWIGAGDGLNMNYRWSQTKRTNRNRQDLLYLEGLYPFANVPTFDPISNTSDWRYKKCEQSNTCPLARSEERRVG